MTLESGMTRVQLATGHMPNKLPHQSLTTTQAETNMWVTK